MEICPVGQPHGEDTFQGKEILAEWHWPLLKRKSTGDHLKACPLEVLHQSHLPPAHHSQSSVNLSDFTPKFCVAFGCLWVTMGDRQLLVSGSIEINSYCAKFLWLTSVALLSRTMRKKNVKILLPFLEWFVYDKSWLDLWQLHFRNIYQYLLISLTLVASVSVHSISLLDPRLSCMTPWGVTKMPTASPISRLTGLQSMAIRSSKSYPGLKQHGLSQDVATCGKSMNSRKLAYFPNFTL